MIAGRDYLGSHDLVHIARGRSSCMSKTTVFSSISLSRCDKRNVVSRCGKTGAFLPIDADVTRMMYRGDMRDFYHERATLAAKAAFGRGAFWLCRRATEE